MMEFMRELLLDQEISLTHKRFNLESLLSILKYFEYIVIFY